MSVQRLRQQFNGGEPLTPRTSPARTHIPVACPAQVVLRRTSTDNLSNGNLPAVNTHLSADKWKAKHDDVDKKRKLLLSQNQKLSRDNEDIQRKYNLVLRDLESCRREAASKDMKLKQLRKVSEAVYKEYEKLKNQYELETGSMHQAMERASKWYKENRELKRRSAVLVNRVMQIAPGTILEVTDDTDSGMSTDTDDFDELRKSAEELSRDVARLQAEVNAAKLQEFEAQETIMDLNSQLDDERNLRALAESELKELRDMRNNLDQVSRLVAAEVSSLREQCEREKEISQRLKQDADKANKERTVLAHQSQLLMCDVLGDERLMQVLMEVESLKRSLEEEKQRHSADVQALQEKLEEKENCGQVEVLEEKLQLVEAELSCAIQRAERAETITHQLSDKLRHLEEEANKIPPPPPPPPLPPPPPPMPGRGIQLRHRGDGAETCHTTAVLEMANLLGLQRRISKPSDTPGAIDDIINQIKGGHFTLKSTDPKPRENKEEDKPPVVQEMINVLGTLRKRRTPSMRRQADKVPSDVVL